MTLSLDPPRSPVAERLLAPVDRVALGDLPDRWFHQTIAVRLPGLAAAAGDPALPGRIRGALGHQLMRTASDAALAGTPCPWDPPCAYEVLFREQGQLTGGLGLPRPMVVSAVPLRDDLVVRLSVFGFACDWSDSAGEALVAALRHGDPLRRPAPPAIRSRDLRTVETLAVPPDRRFATLTFVSPLCIRDGDPGRFAGPAALIASLGNRVGAMARWQDCAVDADWRALVDRAATLGCDASALRPVDWVRSSARQGGRAIPMRGLVGPLVLEGALGDLAALLALGATCHAGSHAALGLGAYTLTLA